LRLAQPMARPYTAGARQSLIFQSIKVVVSKHRATIHANPTYKG
jgi:hypothetical protein